MRQRRTTAWIVLSLILLTTGWRVKGADDPPAPAQPSAGSKDSRKGASSQQKTPAQTAVPTDEVTLLKQQLALQQQQIEQLRVALEEQRQLLERALQAGQVSSNQVPNLGQVASVKPAVPASRAALTASALPIRALPTAQNPSPADMPPPDIELVKGELAAVADSAAQTNQRVTKLENDLKDTAKKSDGQGKQLGNFNFSGDLRMRYEPFFQDGNPTRQRERIRARLNINGKITEEVSGGISLATGSLDDPISTNQTMTGFFNRKQFSIDRAFITYKPKFFKELTLDAGKFKYPWYRTPLTFDNDVNPEGFAETLAFDLKSPGLKNFTIVGFELPFNELSGSYQKGAGRPYALDPAKPAYDSFVFGGQMQMKFQLSDKAKLGLYAAGVNFNRSNPIALALVSGDLKPSLANSNSYSYAADGTTVTGYLVQVCLSGPHRPGGLPTDPEMAPDSIYRFRQQHARSSGRESPGFLD